MPAVHDPGQVALRRGIRAAIAVPVATWIAAVGLGSPSAAAFASLGTVGLLITTDYAGPWRLRLGSYLTSGLVGTAIISVGWACAAPVWLALAATAMVGFAISFAGVMRGSLALGAPALMVVYLVAVNLGHAEDALGDYLVGWWVAVGVSTLTALLVLPRDRRLDVRGALASCLDAAADVVGSGWDAAVDPTVRAATVEAFHASVTALDKAYGGQPFRPTGATGPDRALALLVEHVHTAQLVLAATRSADVEPVSGSPDSDRRLATATVEALRAAGQALRDGGTVPSAQALDDLRRQQQADTEAWVGAERAAGRAAADAETGIRAAHIVRMAALLSEQIVELTRRANGVAPEELRGLPPIPERSSTAVVRANVSWRSPWFRSALRVAIALSIAIAIVRLFGVVHGVWVLLGVMSVLRFDASTTRRYAWQAVVGTTVGVLIGSGVVWLAGDDDLLLWVLLPLAVFVAGWGPSAINYLAGQMAFSAFVIILLALIDWPPQLDLALVRVEDIAIGGGVAVLIGLLLWPGGARDALASELRVAVAAAAAYLDTAVAALAHRPADDMLHTRRQAALRTALRAAETHDVALMQGGPAGPDSTRWAQVTCSAALLVRVADVVAQTADVGDRPLLADEPALATIVDAARDRSARGWEDLVATLADTGAADTGDSAPAPLADLPPIPPDTDPDVRALVLSLWIIDWLDHLDRLTVR